MLQKGGIFKAFALSGRHFVFVLKPKAMPWARSFCPFRAYGHWLLLFSGRADKSGSVDFATPALLALRCHSRRSIMAIFTDELSRLGEGIIIVLHDEATLLPIAQEDGKLRLGAMNHADILNLSLVKGIVNEEKKIAHTG